MEKEDDVKKILGEYLHKEEQFPLYVGRPSWIIFSFTLPLVENLVRTLQAGGDLMEINYPKLVTFVSRSILKRAFKSISFNDIGWMDVTMGGLVQLKPLSSIHTSGPSLMYGRNNKPTHTHAHTGVIYHRTSWPGS